MELSTAERFQLLKITAGLESNLATLRIIRDLRHDLSFSEEELQALNLTQDGTTLRWTGTTPDKAVELGPAARGAVVNVFKKLEAEERLTLEHLPLYEKFLDV